MSDYPSYLIHYGIQGQKWGVRRFQNEDGTWTEEGKQRRGLGKYYDTKTERFTKKGDSIGKHKPVYEFLKERKKAEKDYDKALNKYNKKMNEKNEKKLIKKGQELSALEKIADNEKLFDNYIGDIRDYKGSKLSELTKNQKIMKMKLNNLYEKNDAEKAGFIVDRWGYANKKGKNGIEYMFSTDKNNENVNDKLSVYRNLETKMPKIKNDLDKKVDKIIKEELNAWNIPSNHEIELQSVYIYSNNSAEANYWDNSLNDPLGGHEISVEFDPKTGKYRGYSLNG